MSRQIAGTGASGDCTQETGRLYVHDGYDSPAFMDALMTRFCRIAAVCRSFYRKMKSQQKAAVLLPEKHVNIKVYFIYVFVVIRGSLTI